MASSNTKSLPGILYLKKISFKVLSERNFQAIKNWPELKYILKKVLEVKENDGSIIMQEGMKCIERGNHKLTS